MRELVFELPHLLLRPVELGFLVVVFGLQLECLRLQVRNLILHPGGAVFHLLEGLVVDFLFVVELQDLIAKVGDSVVQSLDQLFLLRQPASAVFKFELGSLHVLDVRLNKLVLHLQHFLDLCKSGSKRGQCLLVVGEFNLAIDGLVLLVFMVVPVCLSDDLYQLIKGVVSVLLLKLGLEFAEAVVDGQT